MKDLAKIPNDVSANDANPLKKLPAELVLPATRFFGFYSDSLKGTFGLVSRLLWWMRPCDEGGEGLTLADAKAAMEELMRPENAAESQYAGQVLSALAREVDEIVKRRRLEALNDRAKKARESTDGTPASMDEIRKLTSSFRKLP